MAARRQTFANEEYDKLMNEIAEVDAEIYDMELKELGVRRELFLTGQVMDSWCMDTKKVPTWLWFGEGEVEAALLH
jgi:hypothetical protein